MTCFAKPISDRRDAVGVETWLWADNDGLHCGPTLPTHKVPTGHLWGWGPGVKVHLREDAVAPTRGVLLSSSQTLGTTAVATLPLGSGDYPKAVVGERFLRCASPEDEERFRRFDLVVVAITWPSNVVLVGQA